MVLALRRYRKTLIASGLIDPDELHAIERALPGPRRSTPEALAQALIEAQKLTPFQAAEIAAGRGEKLVLGNYVVLERIGAGGMGEVYKAWHRRMQRTVALKTLPVHVAAGEDSIARFQREILAAAQLSHPNIVAAYDAELSAGMHYLVMEYVDGQNLADLVRQKGPLPVAQGIAYVLDAAHGLAHAHRRGIIHRDVKPSNLIVDHGDVVKVLDLGLARPATGVLGEELTSPGDVVGTLEYMAPEQAAGVQTVDGRADVYGLGCTLYRLLTGQLPYRGNSPRELIAAHREQKIPPLRAACGEAPRSLDAVFKRMVAKQAADRYQTMEEAIEALDRLRLPGRVRSPRQTSMRPTTGISLAKEPSSGDDLVLAPTADGRVMNQASAAEPPAGAIPTRRSALSPAVALLTLIAALASVLSLSWFDSSRVQQTAATVPVAQDSAAFQSPSERQRAWAESLGVPISLSNSLGMRFMLVPPDDSQPAGSTGIGSPFYYGVHEVTLAQFRQYLAASGRSKLSRGNSATPQGDYHPVTNLRAADAESFCAWLSRQESANYRLPTETEFARACDVGRTDGDGSESAPAEIGRVAWYAANSSGRTHQVGLLEPNRLGLHDLLGNAAEWCRASPALASGMHSNPVNTYLLCGGFCGSPAMELLAGTMPSTANATGGMRLVLELPREAHWPNQ